MSIKLITIIIISAKFQTHMSMVRPCRDSADMFVSLVDLMTTMDLVHLGFWVDSLVWEEEECKLV